MFDELKMAKKWPLLMSVTILVIGASMIGWCSDYAGLSDAQMNKVFASSDCGMGACKDTTRDYYVGHYPCAYRPHPPWPKSWGGWSKVVGRKGIPAEYCDEYDDSGAGCDWSGSLWCYDLHASCTDSTCTQCTVIPVSVPEDCNTIPW